MRSLSVGESLGEPVGGQYLKWTAKSGKMLELGGHLNVNFGCGWPNLDLGDIFWMLVPDAHVRI